MADEVYQTNVYVENRSFTSFRQVLKTTRTRKQKAVDDGGVGSGKRDGGSVVLSGPLPFHFAL